MQESAEQHALQAIVAAGGSAQDASWMLGVLKGAGIRLADAQNDELVCRWVDVTVRAVPPEADTIIRTITKTVDGNSWSTTHWLEGLRSPRSAR